MQKKKKNKRLLNLDKSGPQHTTKRKKGNYKGKSVDSMICYAFVKLQNNKDEDPILPQRAG